MSRNQRRTVVTLVGLTCTFVACGVPKASSFQRINSNEIPFGLADTTTTTSTTTTSTIVAVTPPTTVATPPTVAFENVVLYFVVGKQIVSATVPLAAPVTIAQVLARLEQGPPPGGVASDFRTAIPLATQSTSTRTQGVVTVDLPVSFFSAMEPQDQRLAVAQYVLTLSEIRGVGQITFTQEGVPISVLGGGGEVTEPGQLLSVEDYARLAGSALVPDVTAPPTTPAATVVEPSTTTA